MESDTFQFRIILQDKMIRVIVYLLEMTVSVLKIFAAYFSRLAATKKKNGSLNAAASSEKVEEFLAEEQMQEHEEDILVRKVVFGNLQLEHPITYKSYNLCKLAADWKLTKKFSIADLKDICDSLDIETEDFKCRNVLTNVLSSCTCNKK